MTPRTVFLALAILAAPLAAQAACAPPAFPPGASRTIDAARPNQALFSESVRGLVNHERCRKGLAPLEGHDGLTRVAGGHAGWMAKRARLSHRGGIGGQASLKARLRASGATYRTGAENIGAWDRFAFGGKPFAVADAARCRFTQGGRRVPAHSYESLAKLAVAGWMASAGHRRNILNRRMKLTGAGLALDARAANCGRFYVTQEFAG